MYWDGISVEFSEKGENVMVKWLRNVRSKFLNNGVYEYKT